MGCSLWHGGSSLVVVCGFSLSSCGMGAPGCVGSVVCGIWALSLRRMSSVVVVCGLSCPAACGILVSRSGIELASPALEGGFFTTGPPGKSLCFFISLLRTPLLSISTPKVCCFLYYDWLNVSYSLVHDCIIFHYHIFKLSPVIIILFP